MKVLLFLAFVGLCRCGPAPDADKDYVDSVPQENLLSDQPDPDYILLQDPPLSDSDDVTDDASVDQGGEDYSDTPQENLPSDDPAAALDDSDLVQDSQESLPEEGVDSAEVGSSEAGEDDDFDLDAELESSTESLPVSDFFDSDQDSSSEGDDSASPNSVLSDAIPAVPEEFADDQPPQLDDGYEIPAGPCVPTFKNATRDLTQQECREEMVSVCKPEPIRVCKEVCEDVVSIVPEFVDDCRNVTDNVCKDVPKEVCKDVSVDVPFTVPVQVCENITIAGECKEEKVNKCEPYVQQECKDVPELVEVPTSNTVCVFVPETSCVNTTKPVCSNVSMPIQTPGYTYPCNPIRKRVCSDERTRICEQKPKRECRYVQDVEHTSIDSVECKQVQQCKPSYKSYGHKGYGQKGHGYKGYGHKSYGHKGYSGKGYNYPSTCYSVPKCYPVKKWVNTPVSRYVCSNTETVDCRFITVPRCHTIEEIKCVKKPVTIDTTVVREVCKDVTTPVCTDTSREECKVVTSVLNETRTKQVCEDKSVPVCNTVVDNVCGEPRVDLECRFEDKVETRVEIRKQCDEVELVPECAPVTKLECQKVQVDREVTNSEKKCSDECVERDEEICTEEMKEVCEPLDGTEFELVPDVVCPQNVENDARTGFSPRIEKV